MTTLKIQKDINNNTAICKDGIVTFFGPDNLTNDIKTDKTISAENAVILPAWVCAHTHLYSALVPYGMPAPAQKPKNFVEILQKIWWRLDRAIDPEILRASARIYVAESLLKGTASIVDHHESPNYIEGSLDTLADAFTEFGARGLLCYGATNRNFGESEANRGIDECVRFINENKNPLVKGMIGLHASFTLDDKNIEYAVDAAKKTNTGIHVHVAEDAADVVDAIERGYTSPLQRFEKLGAIQPNSIFVHCIHMSPAEIRHTYNLGPWIVQNPRSNFGNEVGYPISLQYSQKVALGVDGYNADMLQELEAGQKIASDNGEDPIYVKHRLYSGMRMMADFFNAEFGPINPIQNCKRTINTTVADLQVVDEKGVRHTIVNGNTVVENHKLVNADIEELRKEAQEQANRLWKEMDKYK